MPITALDFHPSWLHGALWEAAWGEVGQPTDVPEFDALRAAQLGNHACETASR